MIEFIGVKHLENYTAKAFFVIGITFFSFCTPYPPQRDPNLELSACVSHARCEQQISEVIDGTIMSRFM